LNTANDQIVGVKNAKALSNNLVGFDGFTVGSAITSIGDGAFSNCTTLSKEEITPIIKFAGKVTSIGADAF
jgi:hypothetical protein